MHLFRNRTFVLAVIASVSVGVALFGTQVFLSRYMQLARGRTPTESGMLFRTLGGAIGVSVLGAVLSHRVSGLMVKGLAAFGVNPAALDGAGSSSLPNVATLPAPVRDVVAKAFGHGVAELFLIGTPLAVVALVTVLFLKEVPLGQRSGMEQRQDLDDEADEILAPLVEGALAELEAGERDEAGVAAAR